MIDDINAITIRSCAPNSINQIASTLRQSESLIYSMRILLSKSASASSQEHPQTVETISILEQRCAHVEAELTRVSNLYTALFKQSRERIAEKVNKPQQRTLSTQTVKPAKSHVATDPMPPACSVTGVQTEHVVIATPSQSISQTKSERERILELASAKKEVTALESKYAFISLAEL